MFNIGLIDKYKTTYLRSFKQIMLDIKIKRMYPNIQIINLISKLKN